MPRVVPYENLIIRDRLKRHSRKDSFILIQAVEIAGVSKMFNKHFVNDRQIFHTLNHIGYIVAFANHTVTVTVIKGLENGM